MNHNKTLALVGLLAIGLVAATPVSAQASDTPVADLCALTYVNEAYHSGSAAQQVDAAGNFVDCTATGSAEFDAVTASNAGTTGGLCVLIYVNEAYHAGSPAQQVNAAWNFVDCTAYDFVQVDAVTASNAGTTGGLCVLIYVNEAYHAGSPAQQVGAAWNFVWCSATDFAAIHLPTASDSAGTDLVGLNTVTATKAADLCILTYVNEAYHAGSPAQQVNAALNFVWCSATDFAAIHLRAASAGTDLVQVDAVTASTEGTSNLCIVTYVNEAYHAGSPAQQVNAALNFVDCTAYDFVAIETVSAGGASTSSSLCIVTYVNEAYHAGSPAQQVNAALNFVWCSATDFAAIHVAA